MKAREIMIKDVITVSADTTVREIAATRRMVGTAADPVVANAHGGAST